MQSRARAIGSYTLGQFIADHDYTDTLTAIPPLLDQYDPDQIAFYDSISPTTATHGVIGAYVAYGLENEAIALDAAPAWR